MTIRDTIKTTRRNFLHLAGTAVAGAIPVATLRPVDATPAMLSSAIRNVIGEAPVRTGKVKLDIPPLVENGNTVPMTVSVASPMTADDHVKSIHVFKKKYPQPNIGNFHLGPRAGRAQVSTRIRLADSQKVRLRMGRRQGLFGNRIRADHGRMTIARAITLAAVLTALPAFASEIPRDQRRSGYDFMASDTKAIQDDDTANPGQLWVLDGEALWNTKAGSAGKSCADCHGDARQTMKGVATRYPAFDKTPGRPVSLEQRINLERTQHQGAPPLAYESRDLLALTAFIANQSRGMPITAGDDPALRPFVEQGRELFLLRQGQLNLACANCHDDNWDRHLAGSAITQAHPTGYPEYRLEWQTLGSLERRLRSCMAGIRAQAYDYGAPELVALELYLMSRARGMPIETPAVRP